jgi:hypothetical protein
VLKISLFYRIIKNKDSTLISFTKFFILFNYSFYVSFILFMFFILSGFTVVSYFFGFLAILIAILRSIILFKLKYVDKTYLKSGSMFSLSEPLSIKIINKN